MDASAKDNKDIKCKFTMIIINWIRLNFKNSDSNPFPFDIVQLIVNIFLYENIKLLQFNEEFKHPEVELHDDNKRATSTRPKGGCTNVMLDCDPVKSGVHVWRIQVCTIYNPRFLILQLINHTSTTSKDVESKVEIFLLGC